MIIRTDIKDHLIYCLTEVANEESEELFKEVIEGLETDTDNEIFHELILELIDYIKRF